MYKRLHIVLSAILIFSLFESCWFYSFTGVSIPPDAKTVSVDYFPNRARNVYPPLSQLFTEDLKNRLVDRTRLQLIPKNGDLQFSGEIVDYVTAPIGILAGETSAKNRLTIKIHVKFVNLKETKYNYDSEFSWYSDYESSKNLQEVEADLNSIIREKLIDDVFNKAVINW